MFIFAGRIDERQIDIGGLSFEKHFWDTLATVVPPLHLEPR